MKIRCSPIRINKVGKTETNLGLKIQPSDLQFYITPKNNKTEKSFINYFQTFKFRKFKTIKKQSTQQT